MEQSSRLVSPSSSEVAGTSYALGCLLIIPGLLSGDLYQVLMPSWHHSKAYMSALATSIKVWISAAQELQKKGGGVISGGEARVAGKGTEQEGLEGVPESVRVLTALGTLLGVLLAWATSEADSMSSSSVNVCNAVNSSAGVFGVSVQFFAPPGIQLVVLLWAARGLLAVGTLLLPLAGLEEVDAVYKGVANKIRSSSSRSKTGGSSSSTGDQRSRGLMLSGLEGGFSTSNMLMMTSLWLIQAMENWQSSALRSSAAAEHGTGTARRSSAASAVYPSSSSASEAMPVASTTAAAAAVLSLVGERET